MNTRMGTKNLNEFDINWQQMVLPYEEQLEDILVAILNALEVDKKSCMTGNGHICKHVKRGYLVQCDKGERIFVPKRNYKGWKDSEGTRVQTNMDLIGKDHKKRDCYLDSMECANYDELKYRMFVSIESGNMCYAATCAWAIYNNAPEMLRERMRDCIHQLRDMYREYRKGLFEEKFIAA